MYSCGRTRLSHPRLKRKRSCSPSLAPSSPPSTPSGSTGSPSRPGCSRASTRQHGRALAHLEHVQQQLYPHLWHDQRAWIEHLYARVMEGALDLDGFTPCLIHANLASYHLLVAPGPWRLSEVIDFGGKVEQ